MTYAKGTAVPVERSRAELVKILEKAGATRCMIGNDGSKAVAFFELKQRPIRITWEMPTAADRQFTHLHPENKWSSKRSDLQAKKLYEQSIREKWRALILIVKAKLEIIEAGHSTVDKEFLADVVLPSSQTVHEMMSEQLAALLEGPKTPLLGA